MAGKFNLYKDTKGEFRWRLLASNGQTIASSSEGCKSRKAPKTALSPSRKTPLPLRLSKPDSRVRIDTDPVYQDEIVAG